MFDTLRAIAASQEAQVTVVLLLLTSFGAAAIAVGLILSCFKRFQTTNNKWVGGLLFWGMIATALRVFGMWCAGL